ncbi:MAG: hypothetical protein EWV73_23360 [Microcystis wesenbergii Mw_QC_B_20070930_S4D]|nr:MAG: hypothetical protein EWV73_23360 [Microcystis wesenbergii Mw_QC_B_20070930_S4D]
MPRSPLQPIFRGSTSCVTHQETEGDPPLSRAKGEINAPSISLEGAFIVFLVGNLADFHRLSLRLRVAPAPRDLRLGEESVVSSQ